MLSTALHRLNRGFYRTLFRGLAPLLGLKRAGAGPITVFGDKKFLESATSGLRALEMIDPQIFLRFSRGRYIIFQSGRSAMIANSKGLIGIPNSYTIWGESGVVAYLAYSHFTSVACADGSGAEFRRKVFSLTTDWMVEHGIVGELFDWFRGQSNGK